MLTLVGRDTNYRDPLDLERDHHVNLNDPLERAAIAAHRMTFATPSEVQSDLTSPSGRAGLVETWLLLDPSARQLQRRRADVILWAHTTGTTDVGEPAEVLAFPTSDDEDPIGPGHDDEDLEAIAAAEDEATHALASAQREQAAG